MLCNAVLILSFFSSIKIQPDFVIPKETLSYVQMLFLLGGRIGKLQVRKRITFFHLIRDSNKVPFVVSLR